MCIADSDFVVGEHVLPKSVNVCTLSAQYSNSVSGDIRYREIGRMQLFTVFVILQTFSAALGRCCEQRGLNVELVDLASFDPEERLLEEVCYVYIEV